MQNRLFTGPPVEGWLDLNLTLNFAPQMRKEYLEFLHTTRDMALAQLFDIQWYAVAGVSFLLGIILTAIVSCLIAAWGRRAATVAALLLATMPLAAQTPDEPMVDLTTLGYVKKNLASRINGAGCCVFASQDASFRSQYADHMNGYLEWVAQNLPGGGYPSRVTQYMEEFCRSRNIAVPDYTQIVGDEAIHAIREALEDGRSPAVTYSGDPSFYGGPVPHMVNAVYLDDRFAAVVDNNRPGQIEWMSAETFIKRHRYFDRGWAIVYHGKPQLPRPVNPLSRRNREAPLPLNFKLKKQDNEVLVQDCPGGQCQPLTPLATPQRESSGYEWRGTVLYRDGVRIGELVNGVYHIYRGDGAGRSWLEAAECPATLPQESSGGKATGVDYSKVPLPLRGRTLYGSASSDLRYDDAGRQLFESRMNGDRAKPRIIINIDGADEVIDAILRRIAALDRVFIYARDAVEVIRRLGYGRGITVVSGTTRGVAEEVAYFENVPSDAELAQALMKADPSYRPGSSGVGSGGIDAPAMALISVIAILSLCVVFLVVRTRNGGAND